MLREPSSERESGSCAPQGYFLVVLGRSRSFVRASLTCEIGPFSLLGFVPPAGITCDTRFRNQMRALSLPAEIALTCLVTCKFVLFSNPPVLDVSLPFAGPRRGRCGSRRLVTSWIEARQRFFRARSMRRLGIRRHLSSDGWCAAISRLGIGSLIASITSPASSSARA
jgi:hypothetical protein